MTDKAENLKRVTVKCHGYFDTGLKINAGRGEVVIKFKANQDTVDLNKLGGILKDGATAIFVSDQTSLPTDEEKDKDKPVKGQMSLLDEKAE